MNRVPADIPSSGKRTNYRALRNVVAVVVLACLAAYLWKSRYQIAGVLQIHPRFLLPMVLVPLFSLAINGWIGRDLALEFGARLSFVEWYGLAVVNSLANYLPLPQSGALARGVYLKRVHALPYSPFLATLMVTYATAITLYGVCGLFGLIILHALGRPSPWLLWIIFSILTAAVLTLTPAARALPLPANLHAQLRSLRRHHLLARIILLQAVLVALTSTGLWLACKTIQGGEAVSWPSSIMLGLIILASGIANITPGNVGVEQFAAELTGRLLHLPPNVGLVASAVFRVVSMLTVLAIGPIFTVLLARRRSRPA
jgi:uncharacterized membrane protein YbhN (UPF0104 family)